MYRKIFVLLCITWFNEAEPRKLWLSLTTTTPVEAIKKPTLAIFDTARKEQYHYASLIDLASTNFHVTYNPICTLVDTPLKQIPFNSYDCALFILCPEFLQTMHTSPVSKKILAMLELFAKQHQKMTIIMFPSIRISKTIAEELFHKLNLQEKPSREPLSLQTSLAFKDLAYQFLQFPIESRPLAYHTMLHIPKSGHLLQSLWQNNPTNPTLALLPLKQNLYPQEIKNLFPLGVYFYNQPQKHHVVFTNSVLLFSSISENFQIFPVNPELRNYLHDALDECLWELHQILTSNTHKILTTPKGQLPISLLSLGRALNRPNHTSKKIAWFDLTAFQPDTPSTTQKQLVKFILAANLNSLWVTLNPQMYYSPIARLKNEEEKFYKTLSLFTEQLSREAQKQKKNVPSITIGYEVVNNFYAPNLPKKSAQDIYGNKYYDVPSPLDEDFWSNEVAQPLYKFINKYPKISHGIPLGGVILDLEMYCRQTTGSFLPTMGFDASTISQYIKPPMMANPLFSHYLLDNKLSGDYFSFLEQKAEKLGLFLKKAFEKSIPRGIIGCYAPNISTDWFYKGFYKGLSSPEKPIYLLTFNTEFAAHQPWLESNDIYAYHLGVLMLSKITTPDDFPWIRYIQQHHDGLWYNRFSRMGDKFRRDWSFLEQTPLLDPQREQFAAFLGAN